MSAEFLNGIYKMQMKEESKEVKEKQRNKKKITGQ